MIAALIAFVISWGCNDFCGEAVNVYRDGSYLTTVPIEAYQHVDSTISIGTRHHYYLRSVTSDPAYEPISVPSDTVSALLLDMAEAGDVLSDTALWWDEAGHHMLQLLLPTPASMWTVDWNRAAPDTVLIRCIYDFTGDGIINLSDMSRLAQGYGAEYDLSDFSAFVSMYGRESEKEWR